MVPLSDPQAAMATPLRLVQETLQAITKDRRNLQPHVTAFMLWLDPTLDPELIELRGICAESAACRGAALTYQHIASLGFCADAGILSDSATVVMREGFEWLVDRQWFVPGRPPTLEADGVALLGIALGIICLQDNTSRDPLRDWILAVVQSAETRIEAESWERGIVEAVRIVLIRETTYVDTNHTLPPDLAAALARKGLIHLTLDGEKAALDSIFSLVATGSEIPPDRAVAAAAALPWLLRAAPVLVPTRATIPDVIVVLNGIPRAMRRWTWEKKAPKKNVDQTYWPILHEYHVQNLLWAILAPIFPDLDDEEYLKSLGQKRPRADLAIPSLKLIIEAKYIYKGTQAEFAGMIEQIGADASLYLADSTQYSALVPFIWDNSGRIEEHAELTQGLMRIRGVVGVVIVPRPGKMTIDNC